MLKLLVMLTAVVSLRGQGLGPGPQPGEGQEQPERKQVRRNLPYPFLPVYIPYQQVVEVHHVVMLQPPNCLPGGSSQLPPYLPPQPYPGVQVPPAQRPQPQPQPQPPVTEPPTSGILDRLNPSNKNDTMPKRPSRCVWAIVACCSPDSNSIRYSCFELLGCPGAFWGVEPCQSQVVQAAANTALNYYMSGGLPPEANDV